MASGGRLYTNSTKESARNSPSHAPETGLVLAVWGGGGGVVWLLWEACGVDGVDEWVHELGIPSVLLIMLTRY